MKEAAARIRINELLKAAGWRFFDDPSGTANVPGAGAHAKPNAVPQSREQP